MYFLGQADAQIGMLVRYGMGVSFQLDAGVIVDVCSSACRRLAAKPLTS